MANANQPDAQQAANGDPLPIEARLHALERQVAEQSERLAAAGSPERPMNQGNLSDEVARLWDSLWDKFRDYERSLVDRIGDVDDDLRATTVRLQRARQTQHEETDRRLRRHARFLWGLALFTLLLAGALFLLYRQVVSGPQRVTAELSETRRGAGEVSGERARTVEAHPVADSGVRRVERSAGD